MTNAQIVYLIQYVGRVGMDIQHYFDQLGRRSWVVTQEMQRCSPILQ